MKKTGENVKRKKITHDDKEQSQRFIETAVELDVEQTGLAFKRVFKQIVPTKETVSSQSKPSSTKR